MPGQPLMGLQRNRRVSVCGDLTIQNRVCVCMCVCGRSVAQSCLTLHGLFQARILEQVAISFSRGSFLPRDQTRVSCVSCMGWQILHHCATFRIEEQNTFHKCIFSAQLLTAAPWRSAVFKFGDSGYFSSNWTLLPTSFCLTLLCFNNITFTSSRNPFIFWWLSSVLSTAVWSYILKLFQYYYYFIVVDFVIHWNETAMGLYVFPIPIPPPTSLSTPSL